MKFRSSGGIAVVCLFFGILVSAYAGPTLDKVTERSKLVACTSVEVRPYGFLGTDGKPTGFHVDLIYNVKERLTKKLGKPVELEIVPTVPANRVQFLQQGKCDILLTSLNYTAERAKLVELIEPGYYYSGANIMARKSTPIRQWEDLRDKPICSNQGSMWNKLYEQRYGTRILAFTGAAEIAQSLLDGRCVGWLADDTALATRMGHSPPWDDFEIKLTTQDGSQQVIAIQFGNADFRDFLSETVKDWHRTGFIIGLEKKWQTLVSKWAQERYNEFRIR
jgi:polar amino acid transport system substrate-binding protein